MVLGAMPILASADVQCSLDFYQEVLGFDFAWSGGEPLAFGAVQRGPLTIMFLLQPELVPKIAGHQLWIKVDDADAIHAEHLHRGAKVISPPDDKPWGVREYTVEDPSGYHLRFAGPPSSEAKPSEELPKGITIQARKPTQAEFQAVSGKEFYKDGIPPEILERSWGGAVALSPKGEPIGMARTMLDAPGWFSIWDVAVLPEWQGKHIGQRLMEAAIEAVHAASPGAHVYLFTFKHAFYERIGFNKESVSMRQA